MTSSSGIDVQRRTAGWLPDQDALEDWLAGHRERVRAQGEDVALHPTVVELRDLIDTDPVVRSNFHQMIAQVPGGKPYRQRHLQSVPQLLRLINAVLTLAPEFGESSVTLPLNAILDWAMGTPAGFAAFRDPRVNAKLKDILSAWCEFLSSPDSLYVLNDSPTGWKSDAARRAVGMDQFAHDPTDEHWGFGSWNDFFTRRFVDGARPVADPEDPSVIVSACESTPYRITTNVGRHDRFWLKEEPYSLNDMLANDDAVDQFVGGTVFQAFLSATNYHRWHSPVSGTIVRAFVEEGTYYSESDHPRIHPDPTNAQAYLAHVATRAIIVIDADDPVIGLVAFVAVGMSEVSSCIILPTMTPGHHVPKGDELGYFQFGGSTHCLVFRPGVVADVALSAVPQPHDSAPPLVQVRSRLATTTGHR